MRLDRFDPAAFLRDHWQKRAVLIANPWAEWTNPLEPEELAGLACEAEVESRLITGSGGQWRLEHGPIAESRFAGLPESEWTLLVQAVDHYVPQVAALIEPFRFIPNWRIDDVMVSYAADGGSAGPHFDQYDVFLIQGLGHRKWRVGGRCDENSPILDHPDLRLLADFEVSEEWLLGPGDILYVPPGIAHHGIAVGDDCMTYSVGFRSPSASELIEGWSEHLLDSMEEGERYRDRDLQGAGANPGEIPGSAIADLHALAMAGIDDRRAFGRWFGQFSTAPKYPERDWSPQQPPAREEIRDSIAAQLPLRRNPASRFAFVREDRGLLLFVDGRAFECSGALAAFAELVCAQPLFRADPGLSRSPLALDLIATLVGQGSLAFEEEA